MFDIVVALVTYNRRNCLEKVLKGLEKQEQKISRIVLVDNNSTDDTNDFISSLLNQDVSDYLTYHAGKVGDIEIIYYRNNVNAGGSGGFYIAIDKAIEFDSDYIWIMDDDVLPEPDCLKRMIDAMSEDIKACIPNRTDVNFDDHACKSIDFYSISKFRMYKRKEFYEEPLHEKYYYVCDMAFEGPLIKTEVVKKVGLPNTEFFIEYDDTDYAQRLLKYTKILFVTEAVLHRQLAKKNNNAKKNYKYDWRSYYSIRNNILFNQMYGQTWGAKYLGTLFLLIFHIVKSVYRLQICNLPIIIKATIDGVTHKTGIIVKPK